MSEGVSMRTSEAILYDFDNPCIAPWSASPHVSRVSTVRERVVMETLLDMRGLLVELKDVINECKEELQEIKQNTA